MTETLVSLLWRLSEGGVPAILPGNLAKDHPGPAFEALLNRRIIVERAPVTEWSLCSGCECGLDQRPIQTVGDRFVAACPLDSAKDTSLTAQDTRQFEIDIAQLIAETATQSGFTKRPEMVTNGAWHLGARTHGAVFAMPSVATWRVPGLLQALRASAGGSTILVVGAACPDCERQRVSEAGVYWLAIRDALSDDPKRPFVLDLGRLRPATATDLRLVLDQVGKSVKLDGATCALSPRSFALLSLLAGGVASGAGVVSRLDIEKRLWPATANRMSQTAAGDAVRDLRRQLEKCRGTKSRPGNLIITRPRQGYQLDVPVDEIRIIG